jgi:hypothetical protein
MPLFHEYEFPISQGVSGVEFHTRLKEGIPPEDRVNFQPAGEGEAYITPS